MLPEVNLHYTPNFSEEFKKEYYTRDVDKNSYNELEILIKKLVGDDCWAITVDNQIVFDSYNDNSKSIRSFIEDDVIRDKILESPHAYLLVHVNRRKTNSKIRIYMNYLDTWTVNIEYIVSEEKYCISFSKSNSQIE